MFCSALHGNISFVCGPVPDPKLCEIGSRFSSLEEGSGNAVHIAPALSYESFNLLSYSLSPSIFITRSFSRFGGLELISHPNARFYIIRSSRNKPCFTLLISHFVLLYPFYLNLFSEKLNKEFHPLHVSLADEIYPAKT